MVIYICSFIIAVLMVLCYIKVGKKLSTLLKELRPHVPSKCEDPITMRLCIVLLKLKFLLESNLRYSPFQLFTYIDSKRYRQNLNVDDVSLGFGKASLRIYKPKDWEREFHHPAIYFIHGGGYVICSVDDYEHMTCTMAEKTGFVVVSVDYRRSPRFPYPVPNDDVSAGYRYIIERCQELHIDPDKTVCVGDSAGAHACLVLNQRLARDGAPYKPLGQFLIYPVTQMYTYTTESYRSNCQYASGNAKDAIGLLSNYFGASKMDFADLANDHHVSEEVCREHGLQFHDDHDRPYTPQRQKLMEKYDKLHTNTELSPLFSNSLDRQPYTYVVAATFDTLKDDSTMLITKLTAANVRTTFIEVASLHAFVSFMPYYKPGLRTFNDICLRIIDLLNE